MSERKRLLIVFHTQSGNTGRLADAVCQYRLFPFYEISFRKMESGCAKPCRARLVGADACKKIVQNTPIASPAASASPSSSARTRSAGVISLRTISASATTFQP